MDILTILLIIYFILSIIKEKLKKNYYNRIINKNLINNKCFCERCNKKIFNTLLAYGNCNFTILLCEKHMKKYKNVKKYKHIIRLLKMEKN